MDNPAQHDWPQLKELLASALEIEPAERQQFLDEKCAGNLSLRTRLEQLIAAHDEDDDFLESPPIVDPPDLERIIESQAAYPPGTVVGSYKIESLIGEGGMGQVYLATQSRPSRRVALKMIRSGFLSRSLLRRFEYESQLLSRLQHPGIAQVFEAGSADVYGRSQPFFAMEYVQGTPITRYADERKLDTRDRLGLFISVCSAVHHAHLNGIIHRDLKPDNILVDAAGNVKILDFGVARATDADLQVTTIQTGIGQLIGTLPYMSPEQVTGRSNDLDSRSDVYSLGVLLYQLLAKRLPFEFERGSIPEAVRIIRDEDPLRLSSINLTYRGDIDAIVAKALEKDRDFRYQSAAQFAADIEHHLRDEPIEAQPAPRLMQLKKFARRNRDLVAGLAAAFALLIIGSAATSWQAVRATGNARDAQTNLATAEQRRIEADQVASFMGGVFSSYDTGWDLSRQIRIGDVLDRAATVAQADPRYTPPARARLYDMVGQGYLDFGRFDEAEQFLTLALELHNQISGPDHRDTLQANRQLAAIEHQRGFYTAECTRLQRILESARRSIGTDDSLTIDTMAALVAAYLNAERVDEAMTLALKAQTLSTQWLADDDLIAIRVELALGMAYAYKRNKKEAKPLFERAVERRTRVLGPTHPDTLAARNGLAIILSGTGQWKKAEEAHRAILADKENSMGPNHPATLDTMYNLALLLKNRKRYDESEQLFLDAIERAQLADLDATHWRFGPMNSMYGALLIKVGRYEEAEPRLLEALQVMSDAMGPEDDETLLCVQWLVDLYDAWEKPAQRDRYAAMLPTVDEDQ